MTSHRLVHIKSELDDSSEEVDLARDRFDSALQGLLHKDDISDSENESDYDNKNKAFMGLSGINNNSSASNSTATKPQRKRRRKETEIRDSGFHHTYVMRMFDRSVDLAQFDDNSPLYPICRAWMINQPHNSSLNVKPEPMSPCPDMQNSNDASQESDGSDPICDGASSFVYNLPAPEPWPDNFVDQRVSKPLSSTKKSNFDFINEAEDLPHNVLLSEHLNKWQHIRNTWKSTAQVADTRYNQSYNILKAMFDKAHEV